MAQALSFKAQGLAKAHLAQKLGGKTAFKGHRQSLATL